MFLVTSPRLSSRLAPLDVGLGHERGPVGVQDVEDHVDDGLFGRQALGLGGVGGVDAGLQELEARTAVVVEGDDLTVEDHPPGPQLLAEGAELGKGIGEVVAIPRLDTDTTTVDIRQGANAVPLELVRPGIVVLGQGAQRGQHRPDVARHGLVPFRVIVHPVHHPRSTVSFGTAASLGTAASPVGGEQHVRSLYPLAVQHHHHFTIGPLQFVVGAVVPDRDLSAAVLTFGDRPCERGVFHGVVLGVHRQVVGLLVDGETLGDGPAHEDPVAFEPEVPVQRPGMVLLDHEDAGRSRPAVAARARWA